MDDFFGHAAAGHHGGHGGHHPGFTSFSSINSTFSNGAGSGAGGANVKRTSTSTRFVNGKKITTKR